MLVLICALAITATGCKTADVNTDDDKNMGDLIPGGVANVSAEVLEALSSSGDVTVYTNSSSETDSAKDFSEYFSQVYGGNLTRKYVEWEGWEKVFITDFAAEEAPDVITLFYKLWPKVANRGMVYSIDELKELGVVGIDHPTFEDDVELCEKNYSYKKQNYSLALEFKSAVYCCVNTDLFKGIIREEISKNKYLIMSSHQMPTIEEFCTDITIMNRGQAVLQGNLNEIKKSYGRVNLFVKSDSEIAPYIQKFGICVVEKMPREYHLKVTDERQAREFLASMMQDNVPLVKFELREPSLHEIFVEKVGDDNEER